MPLIVRIDLVPGGDEFQSREIGRLVVENKGSNTEHPQLGDYRVFMRYESAPGIHGGSAVVELAGDARDVWRSPKIWDFLADLLITADYDD